jgi:2-aminoethylphosphonate ABC transporter permease protein
MPPTAVIPDRVVRHRLAGEDVVRYALVVAFAIVLYLFVLYPLLHVIWRSLLDPAGGFVGLANYRRYFGTPAIAASIWNSLAVSLVSMGLTVALAFGYAYGLTRTLMRWRGLFRIVAMLPLFAPSLVQALAFIYVFGNNGIFTRTTGYHGGIYGPTGIVAAEVFYCFPHALLILMAALSATDARLYDAARTLGASPLKTFLTVTLPGVKFGLVSACFVVFTLVITDFGAPKAIGGKFSVMATEIYNQVSGQQNFTMGATVSVVLLIPAVIAFLVDRLVQRRRYALVTSSARPLAPARRPLADWAAFGYCALIAGAIAGMYWLSVLSVARWPYNFTPTLRHYRFDTVGGYTPLWNSVYVAGLTALVGTVLTFVGAYVVEKCRTRNSLLTCVSSARVIRAWCCGVHLHVQQGRQPAQRPLARSHPDHLERHPLLPCRSHRHDLAQADGRRVRERLGLAGRAVLPDVLAGHGADRPAVHRRDQHVLLPQRDGDALGGGLPGGARHGAGRGRGAPDGRRGRHRAGRRHVGVHHRHRPDGARGVLGPDAGREPAHPGLARDSRKFYATKGVMNSILVNIDAYRGRFFEVLQETERTQTAVMTIAPAATVAPRRPTRATRWSSWWRAGRSRRLNARSPCGRVRADPGGRAAPRAEPGLAAALPPHRLRAPGLLAMTVAGKTALVTGAARGIGLAIATRLAGDGARVALLDQDADAVETAARAIGRGALALAGDVTRAEDVNSAVGRVESAWGRLDVLVNNAGITGRSFPIWELSDEDWQRVIDVDLTSVFLCCRAAVKVMLRQGAGRIVNIASIAGKEGNPTLVPYSAAKAGIIGLTTALAKEVATRGIFVNAVAPAVIGTELLKQMEQSTVDLLVSKIPMGRVGRPEEVAALVAWLASDECSFSTGAVYDLSGGRATY